MTAWWRFLTYKLSYENDIHSFNSAMTKKLLKTQKLLQLRTTNQILGVNPLHPNISKHILHTVLCTFPKLLTRRIWLTIKRFFKLMIISFILVTLMRDSGVILWGEIRCWSLLRVKGLKSQTAVTFFLIIPVSPFSLRFASFSSLSLRSYLFFISKISRSASSSICFFVSSYSRNCCRDSSCDCNKYQQQW